MGRRVCVIVVNWNGWRDTIECLESLLRIDHGDYQVVVCDNGSEDGSPERIKAWAAGSLAVDVGESNPLRRLTCPPIAKPFPIVDCKREDAEAGSVAGWAAAPLMVVRNGKNLGFAEANNVGMRYALMRGDFDYCWLLNGDTVVEPGALTQMVDCMEEDVAAGMCGSTILYYHHPTRIQSLGGVRYNKWIGIPSSVGEWEVFRPDMLDQISHLELDFVNGASMLVSMAFIREIGLMSNRYFLYFEELDWRVRAKGRYTIVYAPRSIVYHKHGASIGSSRDPAKLSEMADRYALTNRLLFTKTYYPYALPTVYLGFLATLVNRIRRGHWRRIPMVVKVLWQHLSTALVE